MRISGGMVAAVQTTVIMKREMGVKWSVLLVIGSMVEVISASIGARRDRDGLRRKWELLELLEPVRLRDVSGGIISSARRV